MSSPRASRWSVRWGERAITLKAGGAHNIGNALAAAAAASAAGASLEEIALGLADFRAVAGRLQLKAGARDSWIIDDSYNANPSSVRAGLEVLRSLPGATWLVLGDMAELGEFAEDSHAHMGAYARDCGIKRLFALGPQSSRAVETFGSGAEWFADADSLTRRLQAELAPGVTVLIKGSRVNRLERVVQALTGGGARFRSHDESELAMLLSLTEYLARFYSGFHVFQYLTLRGILAAVTALALALFIGPTMIAMLSRYQIGQQRAHRRPAIAFAEIRHAHHGRGPHLGGHGPWARCCGPTCPAASCGSYWRPPWASA